MSAHRFTVDDLAAIRPHWDAAVDKTPDADVFCASSSWVFSAATAFPEVGPPVIVGDGAAFCGLRTMTTEDGQQLAVGLDPIWGFATPFVGPPQIAAQMARLCLGEVTFDLAVLAGQHRDSLLTAHLAQALGGSYTLFEGPTEARLRADLTGGFESWFARRSSRFRQRMRQIESRAAARGIDVVDVSASPSDDLFDRLLRIEASGWKGQEQTGLARDDLAAFYRAVVARLAAKDQLRVLVARLDDRDVGFICGGVRDSVYRGLQVSYGRDVDDVGVGHLLQMAQIRRAVGEGIATYDMGMDMDYKRRFVDRQDVTMSVVVRRN